MIIAASLLSFLNGGMVVLPPGDWKAPATADQLKNPLQGNVAAIEEGKKLYQQFCTPCHGKKGKGDGIAGMSLNPRPTNLAHKSVQEQSDGAIFWKMTEGRPPMAAYKQVFSETQRWQLVNFIRDIGK